jgi:hypothetical protein
LEKQAWWTGIGLRRRTCVCGTLRTQSRARLHARPPKELREDNYRNEVNSSRSMLPEVVVILPPT